MCGRFTLFASNDEIARLLALAEVPLIPLRYNVAPTQTVVAARVNQAGDREAIKLHWGLIPSWADDVKVGYRLINARADTVAVKPSFRSAFRKRRCLIPASGFYEWKSTGAKTKQPYFIHRKDGQPFAFAGLWEWWKKDDEPIESCTIITTDANDLMRPLHDRMPVILHDEDFNRWLDPALQEPKEILPLLVPYRGDDLTAQPVSTLVNNARNNDPRCVEPIATG